MADQYLNQQSQRRELIQRMIFNCQSGTPGENRFGPDPKIAA